MESDSARIRGRESSLDMLASERIQFSFEADEMARLLKSTAETWMYEL